jgi:hemerythrin
MNLFVWTEALATGNKFIDEDHHELVQLVNAVLESIAVQQGDQSLNAAMKDLVAHAREHFSREEIEMKLINFKNINMHMAEHATLLRHVQDTQDQMEAGRKIDQMDLYHFLAWWVKDHIRELDVDLAAALASCNE